MKNKKTTAKKISKKGHKKTISPKFVKPSLIEVLPPPSAHQTPSPVVKMPFDDVYYVFDALYTAFHHNGPNRDGEVNEKFIALWTLFLMTSGWTEEAFWDEMDGEHTCEECRKEQEEPKTSSSATEIEEEITLAPVVKINKFSN